MSGCSAPRTPSRSGPTSGESRRPGHRVIKCNLGEPDFPLAGAHPRRGEAPARPRPDALLRPAGHPAAARGDRARHGRAGAASQITPDRVVVFPGAKPPIGFCQQAYCNPGDEVIYPSPGFPIYESFTRYVGARPVPLHLDEETGFTLRAAATSSRSSRRARSSSILNFPSNPTGGVATREQLEEIAEVILRKAPPRSRVYSDEVYENILFDGQQHRSIASLPGMEERTIIVSGRLEDLLLDRRPHRLGGLPDRRGGAGLQEPQHQLLLAASRRTTRWARSSRSSRPQSPPEIAQMVARVPGAARRRGRGAERDPRHPLPEAAAAPSTSSPTSAGVCEGLGAIDACERAPAGGARADEPVDALPDVPAVPLPRRHDGPEVVRADRHARGSTSCGSRSRRPSTT